MRLPPAPILLLAAAVGYIALSQEILWFRLIAYATGGAPEVFGNVLGAFLLGVALGALVGRRISQSPRVRPLAFVGGLLVVAAVVYYLSAPVISLFTGRALGEAFALRRGLAAAYLLVWLVALLQGGIFPLICHVGVKSREAVGASVSWIYLANIVGSTAGPLLTGFVLLELVEVEACLLGLSLATALLGGVVLTGSRLPARRKAVAWAVIAGVCASFLLLHGPVSARLLERLQGWPAGRYALTIHSRSGIIAVAPDEHGVDTVYGGGMYDGKFNVDPDRNVNGIDRAYATAILHRAPQRVLVIGLGSGSWTAVMASHRRVEQIVAVEINGGYLPAIRQSRLAPLLDHPKLTVVIDDGRRWLVRHPRERFDLILMNTTYHWRSQITNLVSVELLRLARDHMRPGGVIYYNTTSSAAIPATAAEVFPHVVRFANFVAASDRPFDMTAGERRANLLRFPALAAAAGRPMLRKLVQAPLRPQRRGGQVITDDNMATEYKSYQGRAVGIAKLWDLERGWAASLRRIFRRPIAR